MKRKNGIRLSAALLGVLMAVNTIPQRIAPGLWPVTAYGYNARQASVKATSLNVRSGPGTNYSAVKKLDYGTAVTVVDETKASDNVLWYKIQFTSGNETVTGYASAAYIKFPTAYAADPSFESYLSQQGFPESYRNSLRELHAEYPSWVFQAQDTGLSWNDVMASEGAVGANLVDKDSKSSWKSTEYGAYDWGSCRWTGFDGATWVAASKEIVSYYMDPRNFLNETYVFQFLHHSYDSSIHSKEGLQSLVSGTFLEKTAPASDGGGSASGGSGNGNAAQPGENVGPGFSGAETTAAPETTAAAATPPTAAAENGGAVQQAPGTESGNGGAAATGGAIQQAPTAAAESGGAVQQAPGTETSGGQNGNVSFESPVASVSPKKAYTVMAPSTDYGPGMDASAITGDNTGASSTSPVPQGSSYVDIIMSAAEQSGVNPYVIGAMILQEQGQGKSGSISGRTPGYENYYNFFNIGAYDSGSMGAIERGLWFASQSGSYGRPWNSIDKSIVGGAKYYGDNYVKRGQDTFYLKKFNVQGDNLYKHQYMTNIEGAAGEGAKLARAYTEDMKKQTLVFKIPVFRDMPATPGAKPTVTGSPNNKLSSLTVTGYALTPTFQMDTENYDIIVNPSVARIEVNAAAIDSKAAVSGSGTVDLQSGTNTVKVEIKAENGSVRTYTLHVVRQSDAPAVDVPAGGSGNNGGNANNGGSGPGGTNSGDGAGNNGAGQTGGPSSGTAAKEQTQQAAQTTAAPAGQSQVQIGIAPDGSVWSTAASTEGQAPTAEAPTAAPTAAAPTTAAPTKAAQATAAQTKAAQATAAQTKAAQATAAPTKAAPTTAAPTKAAQAAAYAKGDCNGDGKVDVLDMMLIKKHILGETKLSGSALKAADVNGDGKVNAADTAALQKKILAN